MTQQILVCGNRYYDKYSTIENVLSQYDISEVVCGDSKGADLLAREYCDKYNIECKVFDAYWNLYGRAAGPIRNGHMVKYVNDDAIVIAFDSSGKGTQSTVNIAKKRGLKVIVID